MRSSEARGETRVLIITGMSGGGKSTALRALEDAGYFCIDNLPVPLLHKLLELARQAGNMPQIAVVVDAREGRFLADSPRVLSELRRHEAKVEVLFLDASDESLIRRFSETRRRHPLSQDGSVPEGIAGERKVLTELRQLADEVVDTSTLTVHELKQLVQGRFADGDQEALNLTLLSFGFRYGVPSQADLVFDVRFLPNPFFVPGMRERTGRDDDVAGYVMDRSEAQAFLGHVMEMTSFLLPHYRREGKSYLTLAIGCTGGKHRSVAFVRALAEKLSDESALVRIWDRDIEKD